MCELARFACLTRALWRGDVTRSITGSRAGTTALEAALVLLVVAWPTLTVLSVEPGLDGIPPELQLRLLDDAVQGAALVSACITAVLTVLMPGSRALETMLVTLPLSRTTRAVGPLVPLLVTALVGGPVVVSPLLAPAVRLGSPAVAVAAVLLTGGAALAAALVATALIRLLRWLAVRVGLAEVLATSVAAALTLAVAVVALVGVRGLPLAALAPVDATGSALALRAVACLLALAVGVVSLVGAARLRRASPSIVGVRVLVHRGRSLARGRSAVVDALLWCRDPAVVSTLLLMALLVVATAVAARTGSWWAAVLALPLLLGAPSAVGLVHYGTDRTTSWRRSTVLPLHEDRWAIVRTAEGLVLGLIAGGLTALLLVPRDVGVDWWQILALVALAAGAGLLAGVMVPSDLELPGASVLAAALAAVLTGAPAWALTHAAPDGRSPAVLAVVAAVLGIATPVAIQVRRRRAVTA
jgi:hypothetical protein